MTMERRSAPIMTLSFADSNSAMVTTRRPMRAAISAASFTRLARSAPEKPGVPRAMILASTSGARGTLRICTFRICSRPRMSGLGTTTWRSKRPGRNSAGSSTSGRLVAATRITPSLASNPSISTSSWLRVCSRSSLPPPRPAPRCRPTASISSMKMMQGAFFLPCSNMSRTRLAPTPTNISTKSEPEIVKNGTLASPAIARASSVLPVPGEPTSSTPLGILPPSRWNFCGSFRYSTISSSSCLASSMPATSSKVMRPTFAKAHRAAAAALHLAHEKDPHADQQQHREPRDQHAEQRGHIVVNRGGGDSDPLVDQPADKAGIVGRIGREGAAVGEVAADRVALDRDVGDLSAIDVVDKVGEGQRRLRTVARRGLEQVEQRDEKQPDYDPKGEILAEIIHDPRLSVPRRPGLAEQPYALRPRSATDFTQSKHKRRDALNNCEARPGQTIDEGKNRLRQRCNTRPPEAESGDCGEPGRVPQRRQYRMNQRRQTARRQLRGAPVKLGHAIAAEIAHPDKGRRGGRADLETPVPQQRCARFNPGWRRRRGQLAQHQKPAPPRHKAQARQHAAAARGPEQRVKQPLDTAAARRVGTVAETADQRR